MEIIFKILTFLSGGLSGAIFTSFLNKRKNRMQVMECHYIEDGILSKIPTIIETGELCNNIYSKKFILRNTTNTDHKSFKVFFEFDKAAKITQHTNNSKLGTDKFRGKLSKQNEYAVTIQNFNRADEVTFIFEIANINKDVINVIADCIGFKIRVKDKRKPHKKTKFTQVSKQTINA